MSIALQPTADRLIALLPKVQAIVSSGTPAKVMT